MSPVPPHPRTGPPVRLGRTLAALGCVLATLLAPAAAEDPPTRGPVAVGLAPAPGGTPTVVLDGVEIATVVRPLGDADGPAPDDLVRVGACWVRRGTTRLVFRSGPGRLYRVAEDGRERLVGVTVVGTPVGEAIAGGVRIGEHVRYGLAPEADTFGDVPDAGLADLECVRVVRPTEAQVARLARLELARVVCVDAGAADDPVPTLPEAIEHLVLGDGLEGKGPRELAGLEAYPRLVSLALGARSDGPTDLHPLRGLVALRSLDLGGRDVAHVRALARLTALRTLDAAGCIVLDDLRPLAGLAALHTLDVSFTAVDDLGPLARLPALRTLTAVSTRATSLPTEGFDALRTLRLLGTDVPRAAIAAFAARRPACVVAADARTTLVPALAGATRVRVRTGGTCHRVAAQERTLADVRDPAAVAAFVAALRFATPEFADDATTCGSPTFEVFAGERFVASLGLHGGALLRWAGGGWPGDARLADDAQDALAAWAATHGVTGPRAEVAARRRAAAAEAHRVRRYRELLPPDGEAGLASLADDPAAMARAVLPPALPLAARLARAWRILGAGSSLESPVPGVVHAWLATVDRADLEASAAIAVADAEPRLGLTRWLLDVPRARALVSGEALDRLLPAWLDALLADPVPEVVADGVALGAVLGRRVVHARLLRHLEARAAVLAAPDTADPFLVAEADRLVDALADRGDDATAARVRAVAAAWPKATAARVAAILARAARERAAVPAPLLDALFLEATAGGEPGALLEAHVPDPAARARLAFRLLAFAGDVPEPSAAGRAAREALEQDAAAALAVAAAVADGDADAAEVVEGAGLFLIAYGGARDVPPTTRDVLLARAGPRLLARGDEAARADVVARIARVEGDAATALLRRVLAGARFTAAGAPRPTDGPDGLEGSLARFAAAYALLDRGDVASHDAVRALAPSLAPPERAWIERKLASPLPGREARPPTDR